MKRKRGKPDVSFEVDLNLVNAGALVGQGRLQVLPSVGYTQLGPQSLSYSSEGVVAAVFSADKSGTDAIVFMDAIADPLGEPLAAMNTIAILESETATSEGTYGRERATPTDNLSKSIYSNGFREHVKEVSWGPVIGIQEGLEVTPLALVTVSGKAGLLLVQRKSRSILLEAKPTFLRVSGHATAVSWRPLTIPLPAKDRVADDPKIQTLLATGTLAGSISIWLVRNVPVSDNGPKRVARLTTITPPGHVPSTDHRKPRGDAVVAMDWVATEVGILWDNLVVLRGRGRVEIWSCTVRESDDDTQPEATLDHSLNLEPPRMAPVSCLKIQALSLNDKLHVVVPYDLDLVLFVVDEEGALLDPVRTRTNHTKPITGIAATAHWIATCAHDGKILLYPFGGEVLANLGCSVDGAGVRKPPQLSSIEVANTLPATPHSLAFSPTGTVLLVYKVISQRETPMQRPKCTHNLLPIYISSAAKPAHQLALMLKAPTIGKASEAATFGAGGILSSVWACCHSSELRGSGGVDWFSAVQVALHKYMQRRELRHPSVAELLTPLRLASALIHYVPPWASASHPVTPDPAYPATQPSASASVIRTEILKVCARASLRYLILHPPASFPLQEMESALTMASLLASSAARAVALWTHGLSQEEESRLGASEGMTKEQKIQAKLKSTAVFYNPKAGSANVAASMKKLATDLELANKIATVSENQAILQSLVVIKQALARVYQSCEKATLTSWILPSVDEAQAEAWQKAVRPLRIQGKCTLCSEKMSFDLTVHTLSDKCSNGHVNQLCSATLLQLEGIQTGLQHGVCVSCGSAVSIPRGTLCIPPPAATSVPTSRWPWLCVPELSTCLICGYRVSRQDDG